MTALVKLVLLPVLLVLAPLALLAAAFLPLVDVDALRRAP